MRLTYAIKFVADMGAAVAFYRDQIGLQVKFTSAEWSEFITGETTLALHAASAENPPGSVQLGFGTHDLDSFYTDSSSAGIHFTGAIETVHGTRIARLRDVDGAEISVSGH